jgi:hypothetical protein
MVMRFFLRIYLNKGAAAAHQVSTPGILAEQPWIAP